MNNKCIRDRNVIGTGESRQAFRTEDGGRPREYISCVIYFNFNNIAIYVNRSMKKRGKKFNSANEIFAYIMEDIPDDTNEFTDEESDMDDEPQVPSVLNNPGPSTSGTSGASTQQIDYLSNGNDSTKENGEVNSDRDHGSDYDGNDDDSNDDDVNDCCFICAANSSSNTTAAQSVTPQPDRSWSANSCQKNLPTFDSRDCGPILAHFGNCNSPTSVFLKFFDTDMLDDIVFQSNLYAVQRGRKLLKLSKDELVVFFRD